MNAKHPHRERKTTRYAALKDEVGPCPRTEVVHADLDQLASELQEEVERLFSNVSAHEDASVLLESQLIELSAALEAASARKR